MPLDSQRRSGFATDEQSHRKCGHGPLVCDHDERGAELRELQELHLGVSIAEASIVHIVYDMIPAPHMPKHTPLSHTQYARFGCMSTNNADESR